MFFTTEATSFTQTETSRRESVFVGAAYEHDPDIIIEILEDMICLATNNAHQQATEEKTKLMKDITGGLPLPPGLNLPF